MTHICVSKLTIIGSNNGLAPGRCQAIIWTNAGILLIEPLGINFSEILIVIQIFSFKKMRLKMASAKWRPFCLRLNELKSTLVAFVYAIAVISLSYELMLAQWVAFMARINLNSPSHIVGYMFRSDTNSNIN